MIDKAIVELATRQFAKAMEDGDPAVFLPLLQLKAIEELMDHVKMTNVLIATQIRTSTNLLHATALLQDVQARMLIEAMPECVPHMAVVAKQMEHLLTKTENAASAAGRLAANASNEDKETSHD